MKLRHSSYKVYFGTDDYLPITYNWELGCFSSAWLDKGKWYDLLDHSKEECGFTTQHLAEMVGDLTGKEVKRVVAW